MRRIGISAAGVLALALGACGEAAAPVRGSGYDFTLAGTGLVFRWTADRLPVRYWVAPDAGVVAGLVGVGLEAWAGQFLYGEFRAVLVSDSADADVRIRVRPPAPPSGAPTDADPVPSACRGVTSFDLTDADALVAPFEIVIDWTTTFPDQDVINCLERVTIHEIGHTIGLFGHSQNDRDLMNATPRVRAPSPVDRVSAERLYHTAPTIGPPPHP